MRAQCDEGCFDKSMYPALSVRAYSMLYAMQPNPTQPNHTRLDSCVATVITRFLRQRDPPQSLQPCQLLLAQLKLKEEEKAVSPCSAGQARDCPPPDVSRCFP